MKVKYFLFIFFFITTCFAEDKKNVVYRYKKYESFDLGSLEIKGSVLAPGDLSVNQKSRKVFNRDVFERLDFDKEIKDDIMNLR